MPESAGLNRPNNRPNRHKKWPKVIPLAAMVVLSRIANPGHPTILAASTGEKHLSAAPHSLSSVISPEP